MKVEEQVVVIYAGVNGYLDPIKVPDVPRFEAELLALYARRASRHSRRDPRPRKLKEIGASETAATSSPRPAYARDEFAECAVSLAVRVGRGHRSDGLMSSLARERCGPTQPHRLVKATQKITKAMQMVAAAKLRRAQTAAEAARPYATRMEAVLANLATALKGRDGGPPLMVGTGKDDVHLLVVCTGRARPCGAFNSSIVRLAREHINRLLADGKQVKFLCVGKKGFDQLKRLYAPLIIDAHRASGASGSSRFDHAETVAEKVLALFAEGAFDVATLFFSRFRSVISQIPTAQQLIPAGSRQRRPRKRRLSAAPSTNTSPTRTRSWPSFCRSTSPSRSSRRCSRTRPRTGRADVGDGQRHPQCRRHDRSPDHEI